MSTATIVDLPKVAQMLDAGWQVQLFKNQMGSYSAMGRHPNEQHVAKMRTKFLSLIAEPGIRKIVAEGMDDDGPGVIETDDFTPEKALTRLAYKVHGEFL